MPRLRWLPRRSRTNRGRGQAVAGVPATAEMAAVRGEVHGNGAQRRRPAEPVGVDLTSLASAKQACKDDPRWTGGVVGRWSGRVCVHGQAAGRQCLHVRDPEDGRLGGMMIRVVAYIRVSTDKQATEGYGLDVQRAKVKAWAKRGGYVVVRWFANEGEGGGEPLEVRVELAGALAMVADDKTVAGIVFPRLDRFSRDVILQETMLRDLWSHGHQVFSTLETEQYVLKDDPEDPGRKLYRVILGAIAEYEKAVIVLRTKAGRRMKAERGGYAGFGSPPYGWDSVDKELVQVEAEQAIITRIKAMRDGGRSYREIVTVLNAEGIPSKRGGPWNPSGVMRVVNREDE